MKKFSLVLMLVLFGIGLTFAQRTVSGTITDNEGESLIGANVLVKGTDVGTVTDIDGNYSVKVPEGSNVLVFSYTGYTTRELELGASNVLDVILSAGVTLSDVVVTALGITKEKKSLGYAVQEVGGGDVLKAGETNLIEALSAKVSGVQVTGSSGATGASSFILIRGSNSIRGNNQPIIVVDGLPIDNSQLRSGEGGHASVAFSNRAIDINQNEIESISVLKGAAATALYGAQAGNGAIIITTKKGAAKGQKISIDFSSSMSFSQISQVPELQNTYSQGIFGNVYGPESGLGYSYGALLDTLRYVQDENYIHDKNGYLVGMSDPAASSKKPTAYDRYSFFQKGIGMKNNLAISSSSENTNLRFSMGYQKEKGVIPLNEFTKVNLGFNGDVNLWNKLKMSVGFHYIRSGGYRIEQGSNTSGVMLGLTRTSPTFDNSNGLADPVNSEEAYVFPDGTQRKYRYGNTGYDNPYWTINKNPLKDRVNRIISYVSFNYSPTDWLTLSYKPGIDYYSDFRKQFFAIGSRTHTAGQVFEDQYFNYVFNSDLMAVFNYDISDNIGTDFTIGHNLKEDRLDNLYVQGDNLVIPGFYDLNNAEKITHFVYNGKKRSQAFYGLLDFDFYNTFYLSFTGRMESETTLPEKNNTFFYYSANGSFVFSELIQNDFLSFGKLRASYGEVGLGAPFKYATSSSFYPSTPGDGWTNGIQFPFGGKAGFTYGDVLPNPELTPERRKEFEFGIETKFLNNRLGLNATYYSGKATDVILRVPVAGSTGYTRAVKNAATLTNKGIEIEFTSTPLETKSFSWDFDVNFTQNENLVEELAEGVDNVFLGGFTGAAAYAVAGKPYSTIYGYGFYKDASGNTVIGSDGFPILDPEERAFDSAMPDFTIGFNNRISFKGVYLSALIDFKKGGVVWNGTRSALYFWGTHQETADLRGTVKVFKGTKAEYDTEGNIVFDEDGNPKTTGENDIAVVIDEGWLAFGNANGFFGDNTEDFIEDASWLRLREISLGYSLPKSMMVNMPFSALSISVSGRNLYLNTPYKGVDPETNLYGSSNAQGLDYFNMPGTKGYTINLNVTF